MDPRTKQLNIRVSKDELNAMRERAGRSGLVTRNGRPMVSEYVRRCALGERAKLDMRPLAKSIRALVPDCARVLKANPAEGRALHNDLTSALEELSLLYEEASD